MVDDLLQFIIKSKDIDIKRARKLFDETIDEIRNYPMDAEMITKENLNMTFDEFNKLIEKC
ncbi:MAG: hypothetical protein J6D03_01180 [Clostridia bacterium]|nr:hypothetical protein [Clostridia bacterium]